ncbi:MAG: ATP cone domain-containing protein, partial [Candidatus Dojkabacteria bacterium]
MVKSRPAQSTVHFKVKKRDGRLVDFDQERITSGIFKAAESVGGDDRKRAKVVSDEVVKRLVKKHKDEKFVSTDDI